MHNLRISGSMSAVRRLSWTKISEEVGFFSYPPGRNRPASAITVYRGATVDHLRGMSWTENRNVTLLLSRRHAWYGPATVYSATAASTQVLPFLWREGEGWTVVVHVARIGGIQLVKWLQDHRPARSLADHLPGNSRSLMVTH
jgi:hypothetical protein